MADSSIEGGHATRWFIVANGSRARAFVKRLGESGYDTARNWDEPDARARDAELGEDRPGRAFASAGVAQRSAMEHDGKDDSPKEHARRNLAHRIAEDLAQALRAGEAASAQLVAPAPVAAELRHHLPRDLLGALVGEQHADLTALPAAELFARLDALRHGA